MLLFRRQVFFGIDGIDWALGDAHSAVNAQLRVDSKEIWTFNKAIYGADIHAVSIFTAYAAFSYNMGHDFLNFV
jgi:hypothetical protein